MTVRVIKELEGSGLDEDITVRRKVVMEEVKILLKLRNTGRQGNMSPILMSRELKKKTGQVQMVKVLRDGNLIVF